MVALMSGYRLTVKEKGRTVLPVGLQRECGFGPGDELVARALANGSFLVETRTQILEQIWSSMPMDTDIDSVAELSRLRSELDAQRRHRLENPVVTDEAESERRAAVLLKAIGIE
jgi:bifunctional DNA-binding transcriptional regulator/antitoxin component of YhaV-PrlF toxin-antitoxin module